MKDFAGGKNTKCCRGLMTSSHDVLTLKLGVNTVGLSRYRSSIVFAVYGGEH
jgi:hypothetical protein